MSASAELNRLPEMEAKRTGLPIELPSGINFLNSIQETMRVTGRSRSSVYEMIADGELEAVKDGARILITGQSIIERTRRLPRAIISKPKEAA